MKRVLLSSTMLVLMLNGQVFASPLVTPDVPLNSRHYRYIEKLEAMGFITGIPASAKPYSRLAVAKMLAKVNPDGMQPYLRKFYNEMLDSYSDEIAYVIQHEPLTDAQYYAHIHSTQVSEKMQGAQSERFENNLKLRNITVEFSTQKREEYDYLRTNASYQPLHGQNQGYRYNEGINVVGSCDVSGSLNNDFAVSITPRISFDKDDRNLSLMEFYGRTHLGNVSLTVGKQAVNWGAPSQSAGLSLSDNTSSHTYVKLGLLEPEPIENGFFRFLGKIDFHAFWSPLEKNRKDSYKIWSGQNMSDVESDSAQLIGVRLDITPADNFTLGLERVSMVSKFDSHWFSTTRKNDNDGYTDDQGGLDWHWKMPGVQFYGAFYGESFRNDFLKNFGQYYGLYFPQLTEDGSWDLRAEYKKTNASWYIHGGFANGWTYHGNIMGDPMGNNATSLNVEFNNYWKNGDILSLRFRNLDQEKNFSNNRQISEYEIGYTHSFREDFHIDAAIGYANIKNANRNGKSDNANYLALGLRWDF